MVLAGRLESGKAPLTPEVPPGHKKQVSGRAVLCARMCSSSQLFWLSVARMESGRGRPGSPHFSTLLNPHGAAWCNMHCSALFNPLNQGGAGHTLYLALLFLVELPPRRVSRNALLLPCRLARAPGKSSRLHNPGGGRM